MKPSQVRIFLPQKKFLRVCFRILSLFAFLSIIITKIFLVGRTAQQIASLDSTNYSVTTFRSESFAKSMQLFPWEQYKNAIKSTDIPTIQKYGEQLLTNILIPFTIKEPTAPINLSCQAPPIWEPERIAPCFHLEYPKKVGVILNFGFDVDALELHLHELDSVVEKFFLVEGTKIHNRYLDTKPSIWDMIKYTPRFSQFQNKIVHFIVDDAEYANKVNGKFSGSLLPNMWDREDLQKKVRLEKFVKWNSATGYFGPQDIIGLGDTDEIPNRNVINFLKSCMLQTENVKIGIWFPFPYFDTIFHSFAPVSSNIPFAYSNSEYRTVSTLTNSLSSIHAGIESEDETCVLGGLHFSKYPYLPFQLIKILTGTESLLDSLAPLIDVGLLHSLIESDDDEAFEHLLNKMWNDQWTYLADRIKSVEWFRKIYGNYIADAIVRLPWFYECNPDRFPSFHRKRDYRLA